MVFLHFFFLFFPSTWQQQQLRCSAVLGVGRDSIPRGCSSQAEPHHGQEWLLQCNHPCTTAGPKGTGHDGSHFLWAPTMEKGDAFKTLRNAFSLTIKLGFWSTSCRVIELNQTATAGISANRLPGFSCLLLKRIDVSLYIFPTM